MRANLLSLSPSASATTTATSLADFVTRARMASRIEIVLPAFRRNFEGGIFEARLETLSG